MSWYFIDTETGDKVGDEYHLELNTQKFLMGGMMTEKGKYRDFLDVEEMKLKIFETIENDNKMKRVSYFYCHNMTYDFMTIFSKELQKNPYITFESVLSPNGDKLPSPYGSDGHMIKYLCHYPFMAQYGKWEGNRFNTKAWFLDTMGFFRGSLKEMGIEIGLEKGETPIISKDFELIRKYQKRDVEILQKFMVNFKGVVKEIGFSPKKYLTIGQIAMTGFIGMSRKNGTLKRFYKDQEIYKGKYAQETRGAYRGGRLECFKLGKHDNCVKIDINSLYPFIMKNMKFPNLFREFKIEGSDCIRMIDYIGTIKCTVKAPSKEELGVPYLAIRFGNETFYPSDIEMEGSWTTLELRRALQLGYKILEVKEGIFYNDCNINPLEDFVDKCWNIRKDAQGIKRKIVKNILNSLYGKWGQRREDEDNKIIERKEMEEYKEKGWEFIDTIEDRYLIGKKGKMHYVKNSNPIVSLLVTAIGRDLIHFYMSLIGKDKLIYVATDCIIFKDERIKEPIDLYTWYGIHIGNELGQFKLEGIGSCEMFGENQYLFKDEISGKQDIKIGGIPKKDITQDILSGNKEFKSSKIIGIREVMLNPLIKSKIGTFRFEDKKIVSKGKLNIVLPNKIIEKEEIKYWGI